jgi:hypothetical protein
LVVVFPLCLWFSSFSVFAQNISLKSNLQKGDFPLVSRDHTADIFISADDYKVVIIAAQDFASDVEKVTGLKPNIKSESSNPAKTLVIIGTLGKNTLIDNLIKGGKLDIAPIRSKWESYLIQTIDNPFPRIEAALVIVGSDRRGTAFGVYEMSQKIGVSPWNWWADVAPDKHENLFISHGKEISHEPSVKYRGIFLNDEDWGLQPWASKTFEPETGDIGPKTYAKIFELLLRLKANTCWPAMHQVTKPFNQISRNKLIADDYAIVMGSSHAEPMLRNNVGEWKDEAGKYNFVNNEKGVVSYWEERVAENAAFENIFTIGMRGIHDSPIQGAKSPIERIPLLEKIFAAQRNLLAKSVNPNVAEIPQIFCAYKEVLADYRAGLKVPEDVTIVFPDDNFGYIRDFPNATEQKRKGGFGLYYHISYLGRPLSYIWLNTTPPSLIFEEMSKAYENGMRRFWILNVGDIKPQEIGIEFFLQMAYDAKKWNIGNQNQFLSAWAKREFGAPYAAEIAAIMDGYFRLGFQRKPEHLQWNKPTEAPRKSDLTEIETMDRLEAYSDLRKHAEAIYAQLPSAKRDGYYELVLYPVRAAALANERFFAAELAQDYQEQQRADAILWARKSIAADKEIASETSYFNEKLAGGKWRFMMAPEMSPGQWPSMRSTPPKLSESDFKSAKNETKPAMETEKRENPSANSLPKMQNSKKAFVDVGGIVSMEAENFTRKENKSGFAWQPISGLGKTGDSVSIFPPKAHTFTILRGGSPSLEYHFRLAAAGEFDAQFYLMPTQPLVAGNGLRFAVSVDKEKPQILSVGKIEVASPQWENNVLNQTCVGQTRFKFAKGNHVLRIFAVDSGVVLDKIVLHTGKLPTSYLGPAETSIMAPKK